MTYIVGDFPFEEIRMSSGDYFPTLDLIRSLGYADNQIWSVIEADGIYTYSPSRHYINLLGYVATVEAHDDDTYYEEPAFLDDEDEDDEDEDDEDEDDEGDDEPGTTLPQSF